MPGVRSGPQGGWAVHADAPRSSAEARFRVLIVDDDPSVVESMQAVLCDDLDVATAYSGERAMELLEIISFHVVCSDYLMPGMNGAELLRRASSLPQSVGCLMITGAEEYFQARTGTRHYVLLKPVDPERLLNMILHLGRMIEMKRSVERLSSGIRR
jgi:YesN/AraC family two-component response regulator